MTEGFILFISQNLRSPAAFYQIKIDCHDRKIYACVNVHLYTKIMRNQLK